MRYRIFDFDIESEVVLPCSASLASHSSVEPARWPLEIVFRARPDWSLGRAMPIGRTFWSSAYDVGDGVLLSAHSEVALYFRGDGGRVEVHYNRDCPQQCGLVGIKLINVGMGILHLLRGALPLHGASVELDGHLFGVMAPSGTGKSTLLWRLLDGGALFSGDDLLPVCFDEKKVVASPSISLHGKLSGAALQKRGLPASDFQEIVPGGDEFWIPMPAEKRTFTKRPPRALFILSPHVASKSASEEPIFIRRVAGGDAVSLLLANTQGLWAVSAFLNSKTLMENALRLGREVPIFTLHYARDYAVLPRVRETLSHIVSKGLVAL